MSNDEFKPDRDSITFLVAASILTILIWFIPLASILVYPLRLFVTFIHEGGHALAALLTFGSVDRFIVFANASGETYTRGGMPLVIASAGYLASTAYGASLLVLCRQGKDSKTVFTVTAGLILALTALFAADTFSWVTGILLSAVLIGIAIWSTTRLAHFFLSFLAVQCCLNAIFDLNTLFLISSTSRSHSDAATMEYITMIPASIWAAFWLIISIFTLIAALRSHAR
jgi:Peptidase M50B-like